MTPTRARVAAASAAWIYVPDDALVERTDDYTVVGYPLDWQLPTQVYGVDSARPTDALLTELTAVVRGWGRPEFACWVHDEVRPPGLEARLRAVAGPPVETVAVLALELTDAHADGRAGPPPAAGVTAEVVADLGTARVYDETNQAAWDAAPAGPLDRQRWVDQAGGDGPWLVLGRVDGEPVAVGGVVLVDGVARLWGAATREGFRGRGAYRAVLAGRLQVARRHGAELALVKGRVTTSGPILRRLGFAAFGEERAYRVPV